MNGLIESVKWKLFVFLNKLERLLSQRTLSGPRPKTQITNFQTAEHYDWVYCTTIGEVNACRPFIDHLYAQKNSTIVLLTDRNCYQESYLNHYPNAIIVELTCEFDEYKVLLNKLPPTRFFVCEIPCSAHDAPCRLPYGMLRAVKSINRPIYLINGWLYDYAPSCRMDDIETRLFKSEYINAFTRMTVQTEETAAKLVAMGANTGLIQVTGNMKFDCVSNQPPSLANRQTETIIKNLKQSTHPVFVAGCLINKDEFSNIATVYSKLKAEVPDLVGVFAPRHPENKLLMADIEEILQKSGFVYNYKSKFTDADISTLDILVLDTIGELKAFFSAGDICYMGQNHNILEPLSFNKPVFTIDGWESTYPSYPVYCVAVESDLIETFPDFESMLKSMIRYLTLENQRDTAYIEQHLMALKGATSKNVNWILDE